ncbi:RNA-directed DNA polymerase from mobile element jockey-like, partial [Brachionus plicatilis]
MSYYCRDNFLSKKNCQNSEANLATNNSRTASTTASTTHRSTVEIQTIVGQNNSEDSTSECLACVPFVCLILLTLIIIVLSNGNFSIKNERVYFEGHQIVDRLSEYFSSVFCDESSGVQYPLFAKRSHNQCIFDADSITLERVQNELLKLDISKSPGADNVHPHPLKECAHNFAKALKPIFRESLKSGALPSCWKES